MSDRFVDGLGTMTAELWEMIAPVRRIVSPFLSYKLAGGHLILSEDGRTISEAHPATISEDGARTHKR